MRRNRNEAKHKLWVSRFCPLSSGTTLARSSRDEINSYIRGMRQARSIRACVCGATSLEINILNSPLIPRTRETCRINNPGIICADNSYHCVAVWKTAT